MAKKEQREHVNIKWLIRRIYAATTALDPERREMILALYVHSNTFLEADDVRGGELNFSSREPKLPPPESYDLYNPARFIARTQY